MIMPNMIGRIKLRSATTVLAKKYLKRRFHGKTLARTMIQPRHNPGKIFITYRIKITALGQILADQPVGIPVQPPLP